MILVNGDSFTAGEESDVAWPELITDTVNIAVPGASNDYILRSTVDYVDNNKVDYVIVAWTSPNRIELPNKHLTSNSYKKYGPVVNSVFAEWDTAWAYKKFLTQTKLLDKYLTMPHVFISTFDIQPLAEGTGLDCWFGWPELGIVEWMGDCPKGPGGHPLELGHQRIAEKINEHIRHLGWVS
jgi:hypothetical protein